MKHIKKVTANTTKTEAPKNKSTATKSATKVYGMPCLPQHSD